MIVLTRAYAKLALTMKSGLWGADNQRGGVRGSLKRNDVQHHARLDLPTMVSAASSYPSPNALPNAEEDTTMLRRVTQLQGCTLRATDGEIGTVDQLYFDDETWAIRYLVVNTGSWLAGRRVLISPIAVGQTDWESQQLEVVLTKKQVEGSPDIITDKPVSRQHEAEFLRYYGYPMYWGGPYLWGSMSYPAGLATLGSVAAEASVSRAEADSVDSHLRSTKEVTGYYIEATDGGIGHVENFIVDLHTWAIQYLEVNTRNWWPGKKVLISPRWIERISWMDATVYVDLSRESIKNGPEYIESMPVSPEYEHKLWDHYKRTADWRPGAEQPYRPTLRQD